MISNYNKSTTEDDKKYYAYFLYIDASCILKQRRSFNWIKYYIAWNMNHALDSSLYLYWFRIIIIAVHFMD